MKNVLITGGAGFIGSNFVRFLLNQEPNINIINLDLLTYAGSLENLKDLPTPERHTFIQGDICDRSLLEELFTKHQIDLVVHFAAESHVDRSILRPDQFIHTNIQGTFTLLEVTRSYWQNENNVFPPNVRFHQISTDEVYGSLTPEDPPFSEQTPVAPNSPYAASKAASDHLVRAYFHTYGLPVTITNCSNNYGPFQFPEKLIPLMILNAIEGKPLPIYGDGQQIRDWLYVTDHCKAIWKVIKKAKDGETYHIGGDNQPSNMEIVQTICEILDDYLPSSQFKPHFNLIEHVKDRPGHDRRYAMNIRKIEKDLGWVPEISLQNGLRKTVKWYLENQGWIDKIGKQGDYQNWIRDNYQKRELT